MDTFLALSTQRQNEIINTAMSIFAKLGYKKASTNDIAQAIGVSKSMIFHYFGTKKQLYLYLVNCTCDLMIQTFESGIEPEDRDFFDRIMRMTQLKINILGQHPAMLGFLSSAYFETDKEVSDSLQHLLAQGASMRDYFVLSDADMIKFKDTVNPQLLLKMLIKIAEGYAGTEQGQMNLDVVMSELSCFTAMLRQHLYKEEYL